MAVYKSVVELIGKTPLVELSNLEKKLNLKAMEFLSKILILDALNVSLDRFTLYSEEFLIFVIKKYKRKYSDLYDSILTNLLLIFNIIASGFNCW